MMSPKELEEIYSDFLSLKRAADLIEIQMSFVFQSNEGDPITIYISTEAEGLKYFNVTDIDDWKNKEKFLVQKQLGLEAANTKHNLTNAIGQLKQQVDGIEDKLKNIQSIRLDMSMHSAEQVAKSPGCAPQYHDSDGDWLRKDEGPYREPADVAEVKEDPEIKDEKPPEILWMEGECVHFKTNGNVYASQTNFADLDKFPSDSYEDNWFVLKPARCH